MSENKKQAAWQLKIENFVAPGKKVPQAVVLDFNEDVDGQKLKKFEEFKKR
jgi:hypothetical protein